MENKIKEKLELMRLSPYLPYKLQMASGPQPGAHELNIWTATGIDFTNNRVQGNNAINATIKKGYCKPILTRLSIFNRMILKDVMSFLGCTHKQGLELFDLIQRDKSLNDVSLGLYSKLCEKHIDFNNLIPRGLAVDINTLKK